MAGKSTRYLEGGRQIKVWYVLTACFLISPTKLSSSSLKCGSVVWLQLTFCCQCFCGICCINQYRVQSKRNSLTTALKCLLNIIITFMSNPVCPSSVEAAGEFWFCFFSSSLVLEYSVCLVSHAEFHRIWLINNVFNSCPNNAGRQMNNVSCCFYLPT